MSHFLRIRRLTAINKSCILNWINIWFPSHRTHSSSTVPSPTTSDTACDVAKQILYYILNGVYQPRPSWSRKACSLRVLLWFSWGVCPCVSRYFIHILNGSLPPHRTQLFNSTIADNIGYGALRSSANYELYIEYMLYKLNIWIPLHRTHSCSTRPSPTTSDTAAYVAQQTM